MVLWRGGIASAKSEQVRRGGVQPEITTTARARHLSLAVENELPHKAISISDVTDVAWYASAVPGFGKGIVTGCDGKFCRKHPTREKMAVLLCRFAALRVKTCAVLRSLRVYGRPLGLALAGVRWAWRKGDPGYPAARDPMGGATRAQAAAILQRTSKLQRSSMHSISLFMYPGRSDDMSIA
jgi:hypothetical protein